MAEPVKGERVTRPAYSVPAMPVEVVDVQERMVRVHVLQGPWAGETWQVPKREFERWRRGEVTVFRREDSDR